MVQKASQPTAIGLRSRSDDCSYTSDRADVTDPSNPRLTNSFVAPVGVDAYLGPIVVGYNRHLYAIDFNHGTLWQWRDADQSTAAGSQQQYDEKPTADVAQPVLLRHRRMRGSRSS